MNKTSFALTTTVILSSIFAFSASQVQADWFLDRSGTLTRIDGFVLGDDDTTQEDIKTTETRNESDKNRIEREREQAKQKLETQVEARKKLQERTGNTSEVKVRSEDDRLKLKQEIRNKNGQVIRKQEIEIKDGEELKVEQRDGENVSINAVKDGRIELIKDRIRTNSDLELKVDDKNEISVTLPNGKTREVDLPDKALENLVSKGVIVQTEGEDTYELVTGKSGEPVYQVEGKVEKRLLGLFKLKFAHKLEVAAGTSAEDGIVPGDILDTQSQETSPWRKFLERISTNTN